MAERKYAGRQPISAGILRELQKNLGLPVHADDLVKAVGLRRREQISPAISYLKNEKGFDIETVIAGYSWRLRGAGTAEPAERIEPDPGKRVKGLYEEIGRTRGGVVIVQGEDDSLYRLEEL